jgi:arylsulfatase A-like enzyme
VAPPNVILILTDQQKATSLGLYDNRDVRTPHIEKLAAEGILYRNAYTPHPLCVPARVSLWTGRYPHSHGSRTNQILLKPAEISMLSLWQEAGFGTALMGKNHCFAPAGLAHFDALYRVGHSGALEPEDDPRAEEVRGWLRNRGDQFKPPITFSHNPYPARFCPTSLIAERSVEFIQDNAGRSFALWISFPDPHNPFQAPDPYFSRYTPEEISLPPSFRQGVLKGKPERQRVYSRLMGFEELTEEVFRKVISIYYGMVSFIDDGVGRILQALDRLGLREKTVVIFLSDHGDYAGEHGMLRKSGTFYDCMCRVPLILSWPGHLPQGHVEEALVSLVDVMPTLLSLQGLQPPEAVQGRVMPPLDGAEPREAVFAEYGAGGPGLDMAAAERLLEESENPVFESLRRREGEGRGKMIRSGRWKYVYDPGDAVDELYDMQSDPWEMTNLASQPARIKTVSALRRQLLDWCLETEDAFPVPIVP